MTSNSNTGSTDFENGNYVELRRFYDSESSRKWYIQKQPHKNQHIDYEQALETYRPSIKSSIHFDNDRFGNVRQFFAFTDEETPRCQDLVKVRYRSEGRPADGSPKSGYIVQSGDLKIESVENLGDSPDEGSRHHPENFLEEEPEMFKNQIIDGMDKEVNGGFHIEEWRNSHLKLYEPHEIGRFDVVFELV